MRDVLDKDLGARPVHHASALAASLLAMLIGASLAGCGGSDPGRGTASLHVEAFAVTSGTRDSTQIRVQVREVDARGQIQAGATVRVRGKEQGEWTLDFVGFDWGPFTGGFHLLSGIDWQGGWHLEVEMGDEHWLEAYLEVPGFTKITQPVANTAYRPDDREPLQVRWEDEERRRARDVRLKLDRNDYSVRLEGEVKRHEIPVSAFRRDGDERVEVERSTEIDLAGGASGSFFRGSTRHSIGFRVE